MKSYTNPLLGGLLALAFAVAMYGEHLPPSGKYTTVVEFPIAFKGHTEKSFTYQTDAVDLKAKATWTPTKGQLRLTGVYTSHQNLESGINLAYQIYDSKNKLLLKEGARTPFVEGKSHDVAKANFDYAINLQGLEIAKNTGSIIIQFNYVKEHEYWADQKFPEIELPAIELNVSEIKDPINISFSWIPWLAPNGIKTYSSHIFSVDPNLEFATSYRPSVEAYFLKDRLRRENKRYNIEENDLGTPTALVTEMKFEQTGRVNRRLGFVLEGVRWYNRSPDSYQSTWVLPPWTYSAIAMAALGMIAIGLHLVSKLNNPKIRVIGISAAAILALLFLLEFSTPLLPFFLASFAALYVSERCLQAKYAIYWIVVFALISQDFIWASLQEKHPFHSYGFAYTLVLVPLLAAPITFAKRSWQAIAIGNLIFVAACSYYITINLYYDFFNDYPTWNLLTYASQGLDVADSIFSLLGEQHSIVGIAILFYFIALNTASFRTDKALSSLNS